MLERLEKISAKLFQESLKTYHFKDVIVHKRAHPNSLIEKCAMYPNNGVGFQIRRKSWPPTMYIRITQAMMKSNRHGKLRGVKYENGVAVWTIPKKFNGASKRGIWQINVDEAKPITLDNGMVYNEQDFKVFYESRRSVYPEQNEVEEEEGQVQVQVEEQEQQQQ